MSSLTSQRKLLEDHFPDLDFKHEFPLSEITYFKVGGPAWLLVVIKEKRQLVDLIKFCNDKQIECLILGGASNVVVSDQGVNRLVIVTKNDSVQLIEQKEKVDVNRNEDDETANANDQPTKIIRAECGVRTSTLVKKSVDFGLTGLEPFMGVPGRLGGAIYNNSHFQDWLIGDYVTQVEVIDSDNNIKWLSREECEFGYDQSRFHKTKEVILQAEFSLLPGDKELSDQLIAKTMEYRVETQPLGMPSSGCIFRNVPNNPSLRQKFSQFKDREYVPAGFLIDQAGLKGVSSGDIQVSTKHASFMVNTGKGTAQDIKDLIVRVKQEVLDQFQVELHEEVFWLE